MYFCKRRFGQAQLSSSYLNILIDSKRDKGTLFALQLAQLPFKTGLITFGVRAGFLFGWSFYIHVALFPCPPPPMLMKLLSWDGCLLTL